MSPRRARTCVRGTVVWDTVDEGSWVQGGGQGLGCAVADRIGHGIGVPFSFLCEGSTTGTSPEVPYVGARVCVELLQSYIAGVGTVLIWYLI